MHSLYRIVVEASQYVLSAVKLMMETVSYRWVHLRSLSGSLVFAIRIATTHVNQVQNRKKSILDNGQCT